jgi:NhaP-type Na+/H+ or K+/H+ antiporter
VKWDLSIVALGVLVVAAVSRRLTRTSVSPAMAFVAIGLLAGPLVGDELKLAPGGETVRILAEATLAIVLFADASRIDFAVLRHEYAVPLRLLGIGLPLTVALGAVLAAAVFVRLTLAEALVLGVVLAPTDSALGQTVVTEPRLPGRIRQGLNVEGGLNDGVCVPLLVIALAAADVESKLASGSQALQTVVREVGYGAVGGVGAGLLASLVVSVARRRDLVIESWLQVVPVAAAALAYGTATALGGSGFIAAFVAGALFGTLVSSEAAAASRFSEESGALLGGITFLVFGAVLLGPALEHLSWRIGLYAVLSLTVVRMLPVAIAMAGSGARRQTVGFLGWFGPRGLASVVFAAVVAEETHLPGAETILTTTYVTVGLSILAHGISAAPLSDRYARWYESHPLRGSAAMESARVPAHRPRGVRPVSDES